MPFSHCASPDAKGGGSECRAGRAGAITSSSQLIGQEFQSSGFNRIRKVPILICSRMERRSTASDVLAQIAKPALPDKAMQSVTEDGAIDVRLWQNRGIGLAPPALRFCLP